MRTQKPRKYLSRIFEPTRVFIALMLAVIVWLFPFISFKEKTVTPIEHGVIVSADPFTAGAIGECSDVHCEPGFCCVTGYCKTGADNCADDDPPPPSPPTISANLNCSNWGDNGWCKGSLSLDLSASDPQGQSVVISGTINADNFACPSGATSCSFPISGEGTGSITYRVDSATGLSAAGSTGYQIDVSMPNLNASVSGAAGTPPWYVSNATLSASGSDSISGLATIETNTDSGGWTTYGGPLTLTDGIHTVSVRAIDNAGNISQTSRTIQVDTITPSLSFSNSGTKGKNGWYVSDASATPSASDAGSGIRSIEASVNGGGWSAVGSLSFTDGEHTYKFRAIDNAGNITETPMQYVNVDTTPPSIEMSQGTSLGDEVKYKIEDYGSGLSIYRAIIEDNGAQYQKAVWAGNISGKIIQSKILWDGNFGDTKASVGEYMITMKVTDAAGNQSIATSYVSVNLLSFLQDLSGSTPADSSVNVEEEISETTQASSQPVTFGGIPVSTDIGEYVTTDMSVASTTIPFTNIPLDPNILWGAAATAMVGATLADWARQREEERRRKEEERRRRAEEGGGNITARRLGLKAAEDAVRERWADQKAEKIEKAKEAAYNQHVAVLDYVEAAKLAATKESIQREKEEKERLNDVAAARWAGVAAIEQKKQEEENKPKWWEKAIDLIDKHQVEISIGVGVAVGVAAILLSGGTATPLVAAAWVAGAAAVAGGTIALGTVGLNAYYDRPLGTNVVRNLVVAGGTAAVTTGLGFALAGGVIQQTIYSVGNTISNACIRYPTTCGNIVVATQLWDKVEDLGLQTKLFIQNATGNPDAANTILEMQLEQLDNTPGNTTFREIYESAVELLGKKGDETAQIFKAVSRLGVDTEISRDGVIRLNGDVDPETIKSIIEELKAIPGRNIWLSGNTIYVNTPTQDAIEAVAKLKVAINAGADEDTISNLVDEVAIASTRGSGNRLVLGPWDENDGYIGDAIENGGVFFDTGNEVWDLLKKSGKDPWAINEKFLENQLKSGIDRIDFVDVDLDDLLDETKVWDEKPYRVLEAEYIQEKAKDLGYVRVGNSWVKK